MVKEPWTQILWSQILSTWVILWPNHPKVKSLQSKLQKAFRLSLSWMKTLSSDKPRLVVLLALQLSKQSKIQSMIEIWTLRCSTKARLRAFRHKLTIVAHSLIQCQKKLPKSRKQSRKSMLALVANKIVFKEKARMKKKICLLWPRKMR